MRTSELIEAIAIDAATPPKRIKPAFWAALGVGVVCAGVVFWILLGPREDFDAAMRTVRFPFKFVVTMLFGAAAAVLALRLSRPGAAARGACAALLVAPALLALAVMLELAAVPREDWVSRLVGTHARICLTYVPIISAIPLVVVLLALRRGAPASPAGAGAVAGLLAGAVGATFYAAQCPDDSPLFVAVWYTIAVGAVTLAGAAIGSRVLKW